MKKLSLAKNGLSMSQAQSISNLCFQRAKDIEAQLKRINNASKTFKISGEEHILSTGIPIPNNVVELILEKSRLHATQAFLMENIKRKDEFLKQEKNKMMEYNIPYPTEPNYEKPVLQNLIEEDWGWEQLSIAELNEYTLAEAYAAHIGQFIHKGSVLHQLREELPVIGNIEWIDIQKEVRTPVTVKVHHTPQQLLTIHENLATLHRQYEQRVNYYKAKVKNLVTNENALISKENANEIARVEQLNKSIRLDYNNNCKLWHGEYKQAVQEFEEQRQKNIAEIASLRINVSKEFQDVINEFLKKLSEE